MPDIQTQLVLAQNQHAFVQDSTKGIVQVYAGPFGVALNATDRPVLYDKTKDEFVVVHLQQAIRQNPFVPEGHYLVLENPAAEENGKNPATGGNSPTSLMVGRRINISGPATFPLWPRQNATVIAGHHLRSNQYLVVRVYNAEEADKNAPVLLKEQRKDGFTPGALLVIKGTEASFFIPPTGFEVLAENGSYVREALTLERLEYAILLDEDGNKRYERGPQVVFPEATERFVTKEGDEGGKARKLKAIELNDQMGLYIKVIADYEEEALSSLDPGVGNPAKRTYRTGDELFITGMEQRIYYPRPEHALIEYDDPSKGAFKRQRYYGITIPKGEGRFVLDKVAGRIEKVEGPQIFLPDPRRQVIVRRILDERTVGMWYPGNVEALNFNRSLRMLADNSTSYLADSIVLNAAADASRSINRMTASNRPMKGGEYEGSALQRGSQFTPPPMLTLDTKYDGVPCIAVWTGYAVQVVDKSGGRRVAVGPTTLLLEYDESLEVLELSTGKPKTTDQLKRDVYLRVDNNLVSDVVQIDTKDMVSVDLKLSYRVNFLRGQEEKWFSIENYVKYLCDHMRSMLKAACKKHAVKDVMEDAATIVRNTLLGEKVEAGASRHRFFPENGMDVYDVEVLKVSIADQKIAGMLLAAQSKAVESAITLSADEQLLITMRRKTEITREMQELSTNATLHAIELSNKTAEATAAAAMLELEQEAAAEATRLAARASEQATQNEIATATFERDKERTDYELSLEKDRVALFEKKMAAVSPNLIQALTTLGETEMMARLSIALAPLALVEQTGINTVMERIFAGTPLAPVLDNIKSRGTKKLERVAD